MPLKILKSALKQSTPLLLRNVAIRVGDFYRAANYASGKYSFPSIEATLQTLANLGWQPKTCIDVGAYHGNWAKMFRGIFQDSKILMIEAQESKRTLLQSAAANSSGHLSVEVALLGAEQDREVDFCEMETGSSVYAEQSHFPRVSVRKKLVTLDNLLTGQFAYATPQCLKLDTQGYELEVLKGAKKTLQHTDVVILEVSFVQINQGCPLFDEVLAFMTEAGFRPFDICSQYRRRDGVLWQADVLFIRIGGSVTIDPRLTPKTW